MQTSGYNRGLTRLRQKCDHDPMERDLQRRIAGNEAVFRDVNEALQAGRWPGEQKSLVAFRCECAQMGCSQLIELTPGEYELVRAHPRRFFMADGHNAPEAEVIVERHERYVVVEKVEEGGSVAEDLDPRHGS